MSLQQSWVRRLKAKQASLKFRLPYDSRRYSVVKYLGGQLYFPVWGAQTTTECRLYTGVSEPTLDYDVLGYNERLYYFNTVSRSARYNLDDSLAQRTRSVCFDCYSEDRIISEYFLFVNLRLEASLLIRFKRMISDSILCKKCSYNFKTFESVNEMKEASSSGCVSFGLPVSFKGRIG